MPTNHCWLALVRRVMSCVCCCSLRSCLLSREERGCRFGKRRRRREKCCRNGGCRQVRQWAERAEWGKRHNWQGGFLWGRSFPWAGDGTQWLCWCFCYCMCNFQSSWIWNLKTQRQTSMGRLERFCSLLKIPQTALWVVGPRSSSSICFLSLRPAYIAVPCNLFLLPSLKSLAGLCMRCSNAIS